MSKSPKRPRDLNQWAKRMVDIATGDASDRKPTPEEQGKNPAAVALGRLGGLMQDRICGIASERSRQDLAQ
jgi:hypothetical protein